jgi:HEAT repeats
MPSQRSPDTPNIGGTDRLSEGARRQAFRFRASGDSDLNDLIGQAMTRMGGVGENAERVYREAIDRLRPRAEAVAAAVRGEYFDLDEDQYLERWGLVQLLAELEHPATLEVLGDVLDSPIPPERAPDPHSFSTVGEEVMIRTTAIEALARLSARGDDDAQELLLRLVRNETFSIRRAAVQALVATGDEDLIRRVRELLEERGEERLLNIRPIDVQQAPQAQGGLFLVHPDTKQVVPPPDPGPTGP